MNNLKHCFSEKSTGRIRLFAPLFLVFFGISSAIYAQKKLKTITDIEGNSYRTMVIGKQEWMIENLRVATFNDGTPIPNITDKTEWMRAATPGYSWYDNDSSNKTTYGGLYNWYAVNTGNLCPKGWRVPADSDWAILLGTSDNRNTIFKNLEETGFSAIPGGYRYGYYWGTGLFYEKGANGYWWTATEATTTHGWSRTISLQKLKVYRSYFEKSNGFSVRCIKCE